MPKSKEAPHLRVRIEPRLLARLEKAREKSGRTLTGEIVERLWQSFQREDQREVAVQAATTALERAGITVVPIGAAQDEARTGPTKPAKSTQKDKGT
jgi:hypothetical protein